MKVTYWVARVRNDSPAYNIRARTKQKCAAIRAELGAEFYEEPKKVTIEYANAFDLIVQICGEGGNIFEE